MNKILSTKDGYLHCYEDEGRQFFNYKGNLVGNTITLEIDMEVIVNLCQTPNKVTMELKPGTEFYNLIKSLKI